MEREETEEKESVRKTEKERHEMKYKVGDKVRVRRDLEDGETYGGWDALEDMVKMRGEIVTIRRVRSSAYELEEKGLMWTDEMFEGLVEDELTAEEATKILGEICCENKCYNGCPIGKARGKMSCHFFRRDKPKEVIEILKQWKKDHEEKPIDMESVGIVRVIEDTGDIKKCVYEEELTERENPMDAKERVLKEYCQKHAGKFFTVFESICRVKE